MGTHEKRIESPGWALAIDAGGTSFKSALVTVAGELVPESRKTIPVDSKGPKRGILDAYTAILEAAMGRIQNAGMRLAGIGIATPGPFNVHTGQSLMIHKFQNLHGLDLAGEIRTHACLSGDLSIHFMHDAHAFLAGECWNGHGMGFSRVGAVTLGTGLGFGVSIDQAILENQIGGPQFSLYRMKYNGEIIENRISRRGILSAYCDRIGNPCQLGLDVADLASRARIIKDAAAVGVFRETGEILLDALVPVCNELKIECLVFGGQISKAFDLMQLPLEVAQKRIPSLKSLKPAAHIDHSPFYGAAKLVFDADS